MFYKAPMILDFKIIRIASFETLHLIFKIYFIKKKVTYVTIIVTILDASLIIAIATILLNTHTGSTFDIVILILDSGYNLILIQI